MLKKSLMAFYISFMMSEGRLSVRILQIDPSSDNGQMIPTVILEIIMTSPHRTSIKLSTFMSVIDR